MKVTIIGQGYVGLNIAVAASAKYVVVGYDNNEALVSRLSKGISHIEGIASEKLKKIIANGSYHATTHGEELADSDVIVIAVPTPLTPDRKPDLTYIESACKTIGQNLQKPTLIINESTSYPGTLRNLIKPTIRNYSTKKLNHFYAVSPERVDPGRTDFTLKNTARIYAGLTLNATKLTRNFYAAFCDNLFEVSSPEVAEAAKLFENTFRQVNIGLVNEFAQIAHALGIGVQETIDAASTKPYGYMRFNPSAGVGGHCIPIDPTYLAEAAEAKKIPARFIRLANDVNSSMSEYIVTRIESDNGGNLRGKTVLVVGVSYKANVSDTRESAAELVIANLRGRGAIVKWHDPLVLTWMNETSSTLANADITIVLSKHEIISDEDILKSADYVFDTTGLIPGTKSF